jgi:hypothetical protein
MRHMNESDMDYKTLSKTLGQIQTETGLPESAAFLFWFLTDIYRLEETDARDAICDKTNDKGIDGIYVDHNEQEIHFLQGKLRQKASGTVGDVGPKNLVSSMHQFDTPSKVAAILAGNAAEELKNLVRSSQIKELLELGYTTRAVYITNEKQDVDSAGYLAITPELTIFDRKAISDRALEVGPTPGKDSFTFDVSYVDPLQVEGGVPTARSTMYVFPATATQLVHMEGIADGSLFEDNVRFALGNTSVNKSIKTSIYDKTTHPNFLLFHNGITILCSEVDDTITGELTVKNYSVVNGAQSLTSFYNHKGKLTSDLRVIIKVISLGNDKLARIITENSNNQNAIKPRDMRSNDVIMMRLQREMSNSQPSYFFEIKRGEVAPPDKTVITNELAGRILLSFDVQEPWSAHQIYKVFDENYAEIFGRPEVTAGRIVFLFNLDRVVDRSLDQLKNRQMASYGLTRYFLLCLLAEILATGESASAVIRRPEDYDTKVHESLLATVEEILKTLLIDLDLAAPEGYDYKSVLKSPLQSAELSRGLRADYEKDVRRGKAEPIATWAVPDDAN